MGVVEYKMKTHSREDLTGQFLDLNPCIKHGCKPHIYKLVAGRRKETYYIAVCERIEEGKEHISDGCGKISSESAEAVVRAWQKWNPINPTHQ